MPFLMTFVPFLLICCSLVWGVLDIGSIARSPLRIAIVGLFVCASGFFMQTQVQHQEDLPAWLLQRIPLLSVDPTLLEFFKKFVEVVIYATGGGIIASALILRSQMRFAKELRERTEAREYSSGQIEELVRDLKYLEADALIVGIDNVETRRRAIFRMIDRHRKELDSANRILKAMGM